MSPLLRWVGVLNLLYFLSCTTDCLATWAEVFKTCPFSPEWRIAALCMSNGRILSLFVGMRMPTRHQQAYISFAMPTEEAYKHTNA